MVNQNASVQQQKRLLTPDNAVFTCSAETQDDHGNWVPCAVKCQPYCVNHIKEIVDKEVAVLETMNGSAHALTLMSHGTALLEGQMHKYIATRWALHTCIRIPTCITPCMQAGSSCGLLLQCMCAAYML